MLRFRTLGGLSLQSDAGKPPGAGSQRRPLALLALLASAGTTGMSRDKIIAYLWPESDGPSARNTLKQVVYLLRRDLDCPQLIIGTTELRLNREVIGADLWEFQDAVSRGQPDRAIDLYEGPFLDGVYLSGAPEFERWVEDERAAIALRFTSAAEAVVRTALTEGRFARAVAVCRRLSALDPLNDRHAMSLVKALAASGDRGGALQFARTYETLLRSELDTEPPQEFLNIVDHVRSSQSAIAPFALPESPARDAEAVSVEAASVSSPVAANTDNLRTSGQRRLRSLAAVGVLVLIAIGSVPSSISPLRAWFATRRARAALAEWDTEQARIGFRAVVDADSGRADAYLALAQIASWSASEPWARDEQSWAAVLALRHGSRLTMWERLRAVALQAAADGRWSDACRHYDALIAHDSTNFADWFGRAECNARDSLVLRDMTSPSGWRFRSSYQAAIDAYLRAFQLRPDFHRAFAGNAIKHLSRVLVLQPNRARRGMSESPAIEFAAFPAWEGDSIAFTPYPLADIQHRRAGAMPETTVEAVAHNRETLRRLTTLWTKSSPGSADAFEALAIVLEMLGGVDVDHAGESATEALVRARRLSRVGEQQLRLAVTDVRFRIKRSRFEDARTLADSLLQAWPDPNPVAAQWLAPLAALTGRPRLAARLERIAAPLAPPPAHGRDWSDPPLSIIAAWRALLTYSAVGEPADSIGATYRELESLLNLIEPAARAAVRSALLQEPARLRPAYIPDSALGATNGPSDAVAEMHRELLRGETGSVRRQMVALQAARAHFRLADRWPDAVLLESRLSLGVGDTVSMLAMVDPYLRALPALNPSALDRVQTAVAIPQLFVLRARVAAARSDTATYRRWMDAAAALWKNADQELHNGTFGARAGAQSSDRRP